MFEEAIVSFRPGDGFDLVNAPIVVGESDFEGVQIAVQNLSRDFGKVTGHEARIIPSIDAVSLPLENCIVVGTLSRSPGIQRLRNAGLIDPSQIDGKWESWMTFCLHHPFDTVQNTLVIVGSDARGAIYGTYSLSEQIGISP